MPLGLEITNDLISYVLLTLWKTAKRNISSLIFENSNLSRRSNWGAEWGNRGFYYFLVQGRLLVQIETLSKIPVFHSCVSFLQG